MTTTMAASHAQGKMLNDAIFGARAAQPNEAAKKFGAAKVTNATIGAILDDAEKLACIPTMEKVFRALPISDCIAYAPISGLPGYLDAVVDLTLCGSEAGRLLCLGGYRRWHRCHPSCHCKLFRAGRSGAYR
jgi:aromatic-amino-acid transaminase